MSLKIDITKVFDCVPESQIFELQDEALAKLNILQAGNGEGNDFLGWLDLPSSISEEDLAGIEKTADRLRQKSEVLIVIGIGGSYLGAKAVNDALSHNFEMLKEKRKHPLMIFAGHNIGEDYMHELLESLDSYSYSLYPARL